MQLAKTDCSFACLGVLKQQLVTSPPQPAPPALSTRNGATFTHGERVGCIARVQETIGHVATCAKRLNTPIETTSLRQPGWPATRTRPIASSLVAIIRSNPCTCLPILLGSGIGAGFPGCSSPTSQSRRRRPRDAHARTRLKALWLSAKLRLAPPRQPAECAAVVTLLNRDLRQVDIGLRLPSAPIAAAGVAPEAACRAGHVRRTQRGCQPTSRPAWAQGSCRPPTPRRGSAPAAGKPCTTEACSSEPSP